MTNQLNAKASIILLFLYAGTLRCYGQQAPYPLNSAVEAPAKNPSQNHIIIDAADVRNNIPQTMFGTCIEDVNHEIYGGLYGQMIMGESFEEPASGVNYNEWKKYGGYWAADREYGDSGVSIIPGRHTHRMVGTNDLSVEPDGSARLLYDKDDLGDGSIQADIRFLQTSGSGAGILMRVTDIGIGENTLTGYEIRLNREANKIQLIKHRNDEQMLRAAPVKISPDGWQHIAARMKGGQLKVYFNDSLMISYIDDDAPLTTGRIGLATAGAPVSFRNVRLTKEGVEMKLALTNPVEQQVSDRWDIITSNAGNERFSLVQHDAFNGLTMQTIELTGAGGKAGVANRGLNRWGISVEKGQTYTGSCYLLTPTKGLQVTAALESADGSRTYAQQVLTITGNTWAPYRLSLVAGASDRYARFALYFQHPGQLCVDQVSLLPPSTKLYNGLPLRADIGNAIVAEGVTFMRYGGTMVNAAGYRFKKMIGPRASRPPYTGHWNEYSTNGFGIEDFVQFCEASHITPAFAINIEETPQDAADMVDYLNGDTTTPWGRKRIQNGHPNPYGIRYIEIGNEEVFFEGDNEKVADHYMERFLALYQAIHRRDTAIELICSAWWRPESSITKKIFKALDGKATFWDYHVGGDNPASGTDVDNALTRMEKLFHEWNASTIMRCAIFEENGGLHDMQRALGHATNLNAVRRHGDFLLTTCPANALQPWHQNDNDWDQGQVFFTPDTVWGMPPYYVQQMASSNYLPLRIQDSVDGKLDVTATRDKEGKVLVLHLVNTSANPAEATIHIKHFKSDRARVISITGAPSAENRPGCTREIVPVEQTIRPNSNGDLHYTCSPWSYTIIRL
jgi:alpha-L-arabinofuranosidase